MRIQVSDDRGQTVTVHVNKTTHTLRLTRTGRPWSPGFILASLPKGEARRLRKGLRAAGLLRAAAAKVVRAG